MQAHAQLLSGVHVFENVGVNLKEPLRGNYANKLAPHYHWEAGLEARFRSDNASLNELIQLSYGNVSLHYAVPDQSLLSIRFGFFRINALVGLNNGKRFNPAVGIYYAYQMEPFTIGTGALNANTTYAANLDDFDFEHWQRSNAGLVMNADWQIIKSKEFRVAFSLHANALPLFREPASFNVHQGSNASYGYNVPLNFVPLFFAVGLKERII